MKIPLDEYSRLCERYRILIDSLKQERINPKNLPTGEVPEPPQGNIIFFPDSVQQEFSPFADNKVKIYKLLNFNKPASKISWNKKHVHHTVRNVSVSTIKMMREQKIQRIKIELNLLKEDPNYTSLVDIEREKKDIKTLEKLIANFDNYTVAKSNYLKHYQYFFMNYQYWDGDSKKTATTQLLVENEKKKTNIIFLDMSRIMKPTVKTSKKIDTYLNSFPSRISESKYDLFFKKK